MKQKNITKLYTKLVKDDVFIRIHTIKNFPVPIIQVQHSETEETIVVSTVHLPNAPRKDDEIFIRQDQFGAYQLLADEDLIELSNNRIGTSTKEWAIICTMTDKLKSLI